MPAMNELFRRANGRDPVQGDVYVIDPERLRAELRRPYIFLETPKTTYEFTGMEWRLRSKEELTQ